MMLTTLLMGYDLPMNSWAEKQRIALAACTLVSYDQGFKTIVG